ncbi:MAG: DNA ligase D [Geminicoccaceae bacterium]|nr:DNA ligase D [Geminicoccaceae bacterium]
MARRADDLDTYRRKRDFARTPEPSGEGVTGRSGGDLFVVQKHWATRTHYDFRLELDGVLKSWAVTVGPSLDPTIKRFAVRTEDHPLAYGAFEGVIEKGNYGAGTVMIWDRGRWTPRDDPHEGLKKGKLRFLLEGERLAGNFALVRMKPEAKDRGRENWLLIKERDERAGDGVDVLRQHLTSVVSGRDKAAIEARENPDRPVGGANPGGATPKEAMRGEDGKVAWPRFLPPQLATLVDAPPAGDGWIAEVKLDGYRVQLAKAGDAVRLWTRTGKDWTDRFPAVAEAALGFEPRRLLLDGEIAVADASGRTSFAGLQQSLDEAGRGAAYFAFDLLELEGERWTARPLLERKAALEPLIGGLAAQVIHFSDHVEGHGARFHRFACDHALEGIVVKRADAPYASGRNRDWLKIKCTKRREFVLGGYRRSDKGRPFASLLVGTFEKGVLIYRGRVGTGFDAATARRLGSRMRPLVRPTAAFAGVPAEVAADAVWLEPDLVAEIDFSETTEAGLLRHASFVALREDKPAAEISMDDERPAKAPSRSRCPPGAPAARKLAVSTPESGVTGEAQVSPETIAGVALSHPGKVLYPAQGLTKRDLALYWQTVASWILPHLKDRPVSFVRCPEGRDGGCFFQRHPAKGGPKSWHTIDFADGDGAATAYVHIGDVRGLIDAAQLGILELHIWGARVDRIDRPDRLVFDLDPADDVPFAAVGDAAREVRDVLAAAGLRSFLLTSGGKGLHVVVPIDRRHDWRDAKAFAKALAESLATAAPERYTASISRARRHGRIFVDYLRNDRGATAICPYSPRARAGAPVAVPLNWDELSGLRSSAAFDVTTLPARLATMPTDVWTGFTTLRQSLTRRTFAALEAFSTSARRRGGKAGRESG